ncbi:MAG: two-component regulator propeller domain-containing protein, partial [Verrucomicrobiota bacterium]
MQSLRNCFRRGIVGTGLLTLLHAVAGNAAAPTDSTWVARSWQSDEGLPDNSVCGVAQTPEGYLWVGTHGGLVRFDGVRFEEFPPQSISGVPNQVVRSMLLDRDGRLWLGMDRGPVVRIGENGARVFTTQEGLPDLQMTSMTEDEQGAIWVGYTTGSLIRIQGDEVKVFGAADGLPQEGPCWLATDREGQLWFARSGHVGVYRNQRLQTVLTLDEPTAIGRASAGGLWVCSGSKWFKFVEGHSPENRGTLPSSSRSVEPRVILEDSSGAVWIGTTASGLFRCEGSEVKRVEISHREIWCLTEDREGNIWAGTGGGGLNRLRRRTVELIGREDGLPFESVRSVCEDSQGNIWVVTQNGVVARHENKRWNTVSANGGWPGGHATCITSDRAGSIWIGTREHGLYLFKDGQFENFSRAEGLASLSVRSVLASASGDLWIGTDSPNQVQRLRDGEFHSFGISTAPRFIRAMAEDSTGTIWIGTADGQLFRVNGHELISQPASFQGRPRSIRCLHATSDGSLWIGYAGWGLGRLKDGRLSRIELSSGLHDN